MYAPEQYVEALPIVEALRFTVQQYLRMRGSSRPEIYQMTPQQPQPNQQPKLLLAVPLPVQPAQPPVQQPPLQQAAPYRQQPERACFNCGDPSHFVIDCPLRDRTKKSVQQQVRRMDLPISITWNKQ